MDNEKELALYGVSNLPKDEVAYIRLREAALRSKKYYHQPLMVCYSGGKDSDTLVQLAIESGVDFEVVHSHTTADAPETVRYVRQRFKEWENQGIKCSIEYPYYKGQRTSMWALIPQKRLPPTQIVRYCCAILKETSGANRACATGVRWAESVKRKNGRGIHEITNNDKSKRIMLMNDNDDKRLLNERCMQQRKSVTNPIIDWTDEEVITYLRDRQIEGNPLYKCGFNRVGCIGCPMAGKKRWEEFNRYPKYKDLYIKAFDKMLRLRERDGLQPTQQPWKTDYDVFLWWMEENPNQILFPGYDDWEDEQ